jgi:hypothetical protein
MRQRTRAEAGGIAAGAGLLGRLRRWTAAWKAPRREDGGRPMRFTISPETRTDAREDSLVVLDIASGRLFASNRTGSLIWRALACDRGVESIASELGALFNLSSLEAMRSVLAFLEQLRQLGLVSEA